jgi:hypothetical protein
MVWLDPAFRMSFACGAAIGAGFLISLLLPQFLLGMNFLSVFVRSGALCFAGLGLYLLIARLLGIRELAEVQGLIRHKLMHRELLSNN